MQEAAVAAPGVSPELEAAEALDREEVGSQGGETVALQGEGAKSHAVGEDRAAEHRQAVVGEVQGEEGRQGGELGGLQPGQQVVAGDMQGEGRGIELAHLMLTCCRISM